MKGIINYFQSLVRKSLTEEIMSEEKMNPAKKQNKTKSQLKGKESKLISHIIMQSVQGLTGCGLVELEMTRTKLGKLGRDQTLKNQVHFKEGKRIQPRELRRNWHNGRRNWCSRNHELVLGK